MKRIVKKIMKTCGTVDDFIFEYIHGSASEEERIRRMKEYVACVRKVEKKSIKSKK